MRGIQTNQVEIHLGRYTPAGESRHGPQALRTQVAGNQVSAAQCRGKLARLNSRRGAKIEHAVAGLG